MRIIKQKGTLCRLVLLCSQNRKLILLRILVGMVRYVHSAFALFNENAI